MFRRRTDDENAQPTTRVDLESADPSSWAGGLNDPLLEAMATSARQRGRRAAIPQGPDTPTAIASWVKRLDAEMNVLADLADLPASPRTGGRRPRAGDDETQTA
jgi:hypothetical protein